VGSWNRWLRANSWRWAKIIRGLGSPTLALELCQPSSPEPDPVLPLVHPSPPHLVHRVPPVVSTVELPTTSKAVTNRKMSSAFVEIVTSNFNSVTPTGAPPDRPAGQSGNGPRLSPRKTIVVLLTAKTMPTIIALDIGYWRERQHPSLPVRAPTLRPMRSPNRSLLPRNPRKGSFVTRRLIRKGGSPWHLPMSARASTPLWPAWRISFWRTTFDKSGLVSGDYYWVP
jgi:hypothetical protein